MASLLRTLRSLGEHTLDYFRLTKFFNSLLFAASTLVSGYTLQYHKFHGNLPGYENRRGRGGGESIDPDKAAFSMAPHDDEAYERVNMDDNEAYSGDQYGHVNPYSAPRDLDSEMTAFCARLEAPPLSREEVEATLVWHEPTMVVCIPAEPFGGHDGGIHHK